MIFAIILAITSLVIAPQPSFKYYITPCMLVKEINLDYTAFCYFLPRLPPVFSCYDRVHVTLKNDGEDPKEYSASFGEYFEPKKKENCYKLGYISNFPADKEDPSYKRYLAMADVKNSLAFWEKEAVRLNNPDIIDSRSDWKPVGAVSILLFVAVGVIVISYLKLCRNATDTDTNAIESDKTEIVVLRDSESPDDVSDDALHDEDEEIVENTDSQRLGDFSDEPLLNEDDDDDKSMDFEEEE